MRFLLTGCGKKKQPGPCAAGDLYTGSLGRARARYAAETDPPLWRILSAKYGLLDPSQVVSPYCLTLGELPRVDRAAWALAVAQELLDQLEDDDDPRKLVVEIHAGRSYVELLAPVLEAVGVLVELPLEGLGIGDQLAWYAARHAERVAS